MGAAGSVGLVIVSHSAKVAEGVVELAAQMAPTVAIIAAGGTDDGGIGTDAGKIADAIAKADGGQGVLVLVDLGSAVLSTRMAIEELIAEEQRDRVRVSDAPLVEGAVVAAVEASVGAAVDQVAAAAVGAAGMRKVKDE
jgi:PTS hybrid protein